MIPSIATFLSNNKFDQINKESLPLNIKKALETKIIPEELTFADRVLDCRCVHNIEEISQKIEQFIDEINPHDNKTLLIYYSNENHSKNYNHFKNSFKKIGEIKYMENKDNYANCRYHIYLQGLNLSSYHYTICSNFDNHYKIQFEIEKPPVKKTFRSFEFEDILDTPENEKSKISIGSIVKPIEKKMIDKISYFQKEHEQYLKFLDTSKKVITIFAFVLSLTLGLQFLTNFNNNK